MLLLASLTLFSPTLILSFLDCQRRVELFLMYEPAFSSCKECLWTPKHPPCAHFPNPLPYGYAISIWISTMEAVKNGMQHNLLLESGIQFVLCFPFHHFRMHSINYWRGMNRYPCYFVQKLLVQSHSTQSSRGALFLSFVFITAVRILMWSLEMPSLCLWSVIRKTTAFSPIPISESWCCCESTPSRWAGGWCEADLSIAFQYPSFSLLSLRTAWSHP